MRSGSKPKVRTPAKAKSSAERVGIYRAKMKKQGMRLIQKWVVDRQSSKFKAELRRQARNLANAPDNEEIMRFIEANSADWDR